MKEEAETYKTWYVGRAATCKEVQEDNGSAESEGTAIAKAMQKAFGPYIATTHGDNLLAKDTSGESDRALTWAIPLSQCGSS